MLESYSALLKSLQEVIQKKGFDLSTPMVRSLSLVLPSLSCVVFLEGCVCLLKKTQILGLHMWSPSGLSHPTHHFSPMCLPFSHLLNLASPACPSCVCLTSDTHLFNNITFQLNARNVRGPICFPRAKCNHANIALNIYTYVCIYAYVKSTVCDPSAHHLEPPLLLITHTQYITSCASRLPCVGAVTHSPD